MSREQWGHGYYNGYKDRQKFQISESLKNKDNKRHIVYGSYEWRENKKHKAWKVIRNTESAVFDKIIAYEDIIKSHFMRCVESNENIYTSFIEYACNWVAAHKLSFIDNKEVFLLLEKKYPKPKILRIKNGFSYYND